MEEKCPMCGSPALENMRFDGDDEVPAYRVYECKRMVFETGMTNYTVECLRNQLAEERRRREVAEEALRIYFEYGENRMIEALKMFGITYDYMFTPPYDVMNFLLAMAEANLEAEASCE